MCGSPLCAAHRAGRKEEGAYGRGSKEHGVPEQFLRCLHQCGPQVFRDRLSTRLCFWCIQRFLVCWCGRDEGARHVCDGHRHRCNPSWHPSDCHVILGWQDVGHGREASGTADILPHCVGLRFVCPFCDKLSEPDLHRVSHRCVAGPCGCFLGSCRRCLDQLDGDIGLQKRTGLWRSCHCERDGCHHRTVRWTRVRGVCRPARRLQHVGAHLCHDGIVGQRGMRRVLAPCE
mmetsp:Transcript_9271/g.23872  ORF Transcript_9271/g.23872 Transcript_9271/m.23872 type:complete len:231 (+) Transcript_9271:551-1243(+)